MPDSKPAGPTDETPLKPCPFCGGPGAYAITLSGQQLAACGDGGCVGNGIYARPAQWNRRAPEEPADE